MKRLIIASEARRPHFLNDGINSNNAMLSSAKGRRNEIGPAMDPIKGEAERIFLKRAIFPSLSIPV